MGACHGASGRGSPPSIRTCSGPPSSWPPSTREFLFGMSSSPLATRIQGRPRFMTVGGENFDRHAAYVVVAFIAGG